jgi:predicted RNA-binding Zn-ribbon protein involved in translation (DUF1610 family)
MLIPFLILTTAVILVFSFRSTWLHLLEQSPDDAVTDKMQRIVVTQLCPKCGEEMEKGRAIITYRDDTLPLLYPHEVPTFLRRDIRMAPTLTMNPFYPEPQTVYRCPACGVIVEEQ